MQEELGIIAKPDQLHYAGTFRIQYEEEFHGQMFRDNELTRVYVYDDPVKIEDLTLQESEVDEKVGALQGSMLMKAYQVHQQKSVNSSIT